ncbi:MAG: hypothetical protein GY798_03870 [Hyphomicrobiales bacterium]|nr:hypothetical protein [Hyphomicrobiales bacterium]
MTSTHGMNPDEVEALGRELRGIGGVIDGLGRAVDESVRSTMWEGPDAHRFKQEWWPDHLARLRSVASDLEGFGQSALNNATEQREASGVGGVGGGSSAASGRQDGSGPVHAVSTRSYSVTTDLGYWLGSSGTESVVTVTEMSDGTYRVSISSEVEVGAGITIGRIVGVDAIKVLADGGVDINSAAGFSLEFAVADESSLTDLEAALQGRASSFTNRVPGAAVGLGELGFVDHMSGVELSSYTIRHSGVSVATPAEVGAGSLGIDAELSRWNETTYDVANGLITDRTVVQGQGGGTGWNQDSVRQTLTVEITRDAATGQAQTVTISDTLTSSADVRGGGEKLRDGVMGLAGFGGNSEFTISQTETVQSYDLTQGDVAGVSEAVRIDDRAALLSSRTSTAAVADVQQTTYHGESDSSTRSIPGPYTYGSTTEYGSMEMTSRTQTPASG